ncbi:hypothetical protein K2E95_08625 [Pseudomonas sp. ERGC3:01]|nr:hypothetical protein [Pseudomonas sp. ERGC3:01]
MAINGFFTFRRRSVILVGKNVTVKARSMITAGKGLVIDDGCFIDALAVKGVAFGRGVSLKKNVIIECTGSLTKLGEGLSIGNDVGIGSGSFWAAPVGCLLGMTPSLETMSRFTRRIIIFLMRPCLFGSRA